MEKKQTVRKKKRGFVIIREVTAFIPSSSRRKFANVDILLQDNKFLLFMRFELRDGFFPLFFISMRSRRMYEFSGRKREQLSTKRQDRVPRDDVIRRRIIENKRRAAKFSSIPTTKLQTGISRKKKNYRLGYL